ncbi:hypothetical protein METBIDRAFT_34539 [Metschnikowia bicuspidata var. bicuspidata NRRL YB-4993]|uniref:UDP-N-acetylglucosamine--dolichyl-phosphate N-acetylglucosaminephosphotransferase n=1 Tax=Metschnikowia bicuspidata var. bicuspidata NRRL YB-4993 TaxID=869754 RepID=A0A1A0HGQ8_9ASCO|nr:hypothetical protein METBIDRAFT_34539 [Metschnikowia bicuspidata var. bicuspidata NRRL YB-4993]OBA23181.1 hypothetical protein METBIDRAFT_34539 [Metschnikowia bicuspidata var. bicuspidata NRRL YB-4993]
MTLLQLSALVAAAALLKAHSPLHTAVAFGLVGYVVTSHLIPRLGASFMKVGLKGKDLLKPGPVQPIPESMGVVPAVTYMVLLVTIIPFVFFKYLVSFLAMANEEDLSALYNAQYHLVDNHNLFPHNKLAEYLSGALCLMCTLLLGFFDDLFDIRWRHKFFLPAVASLPLLIVYYVNFSVTSVVVPLFVTSTAVGETALEWLSGFCNWANAMVTWITGLKFTTLTTDYHFAAVSAPKLLDLGIFYYAYMSALSIFAPNSINILAGINGLEVGQSIVLAVIFLANDMCYLMSSSISMAAYDSHMLSAIFIIPFLGVSLGLFQYNFYPAQVFVGDTYCYFSGMVFAIVGILGHFSKTLLIFLLPQILNFVYSVPQLFNIVPCPRHRLPKFDEQTGLMNVSYGELAKSSRMNSLFLETLAFFKLVKVERNERGGITRFSNLTIINLALVWFGPMREDKLCLFLLLVQLFVGISMLVVRHTVGPWLFGYDNLSWGAK